MWPSYSGKVHAQNRSWYPTEGLPSSEIDNKATNHSMSQSLLYYQDIVELDHSELMSDQTLKTL